MQLCTISTPAGPRPAVNVVGRGAILTSDLLGRDTPDLMDHLVRDEFEEIAQALERNAESAPLRESPVFDAPLRNPTKILGIGLNYTAHAGDLGAQAPRTSPASFLKGNHTIIGPQEAIAVPPGIGKVTAEAELGLIIGGHCYRVGEDDALSYVAGVCAVLDQTAEQVLLENPRFLTRVKNYPTFLSLGPVIITMDEVLEAVGDLSRLSVATIHNGTIRRRALVESMIFSPAELLSFHSYVMPFSPGDILLTGTPGAAAIIPGDEVSCDLGSGLTVLTNRVVAG